MSALTSITIRPCGRPSMVMSKKTLGFAMFVHEIHRVLQLVTLTVQLWIYIIVGTGVTSKKPAANHRQVSIDRRKNGPIGAEVGRG